MSESEKRACLGQLDTFIREINALMEFIGDRQILFGSERQRAQDMLTALKGRLKSEYRRTSTVRGQASLNRVERDYYTHAVHEAFCDLHMKTTSVPGSQWTTDLYSARIDLDSQADQLRAQLDGSQSGR